MMMREYQNILDYYIDSYSREMSRIFLEKYWLKEEEILGFWNLKKNEIFSPNAIDFPQLMFHKEFHLMAFKGGVLFTEHEYCALQECMRIAGDSFFVIIENRSKRSAYGDLPHLQFKFPIETTWAELNNGNEGTPDISYEALYVMNKHFFVFGDSGKWGKYAASDFGNTPIEILGFKPEMESVFYEKFKQSIAEQKDVMDWLPSLYKNRIIHG